MGCVATGQSENPYLVMSLAENGSMSPGLKSLTLN